MSLLATHDPTAADRVPFIEHLQVHRQPAAAGEARVALDLRPELLGPQAAAHRGVLMTLLECTMAQAARQRLGEAHEAVAVGLQVSFLRPARGRLVAEGHVSGGGRSICFCEARITDESGAVAAQAMGTFRRRDLPHTPTEESP